MEYSVGGLLFKQITTMTELQEIVFRTFQDTYGEDSVWTTENKYYIYEYLWEKEVVDDDTLLLYVEFPEFKITDGKMSHPIKGLIGIYYIDPYGKLIAEYFTRYIYSEAEIKKGYIHSHLPALQINNGSSDDEYGYPELYIGNYIDPKAFCYGLDDSFFRDIYINVRTISDETSPQNVELYWISYTTNLMSVLSWESADGGPYIYMNSLYTNKYRTLIHRNPVDNISTIRRTSSNLTDSLLNNMVYVFKPDITSKQLHRFKWKFIATLIGFLYRFYKDDVNTFKKIMDDTTFPDMIEEFQAFFLTAFEETLVDLHYLTSSEVLNGCTGEIVRDALEEYKEVTFFKDYIISDLGISTIKYDGYNNYQSGDLILPIPNKNGSGNMQVTITKGNSEDNSFSSLLDVHLLYQTKTLLYNIIKARMYCNNSSNTFTNIKIANNEPNQIRTIHYSN